MSDSQTQNTETNDKTVQTMEQMVKQTDLLKQLNEGELVVVSFNPESREYNERWYTDLRAWKIVKAQDKVPDEDEPPPFTIDDIPPEEEEIPF